MFRKLLAYLLGHKDFLVHLAAVVYGKLGADILDVSDQERRERIVGLTKDLINSRYPQYAPYAGVVIDYVVAKVRAALKARQG